MKPAILWTALVCLVFCASCNQDETVQLIRTGSNAATSAGLVIAKSKLPADVYTKLVAGLAAADTAAIAILNAASATTTLQDVFNLAMVEDPQLAQYQAIIGFALPVLSNISIIQSSLTTTLDKLSPNAKADAIAFFQGSLDACQGKDLAKDPLNNLQKIAKDRNLVFDTDTLASKLAATVKPAK